ncbi:DUF3883 domain-containing protein [Sporosarcina luteola]|uniref:DUF3883 domain-containing protein n=1 Tax=Sporosarcina luteola TaxID=582850 RepID=UPI00203F9721|nr:DUF3883 domain-containing protein [Sporosarcina luteola]MCM3745365.1 DUF3883 domain-containing protein [Sporosarcina luteola]
MNVIQNLRIQFIQEALASPILFNDLANMEKYITESYQMRSIIELLQNADDAGSNKFKILMEDSTLYVANNGRNFDKDDLVSICRSGASTKQDRDLYIGYRGIGFKSVVNFSETIHVLSHDLSFTFSKEKTAELLRDKNMIGDVPLIRVPHVFEEIDRFQSTIDTLINEGFSVIFIFENIQMDAITNEIKAFSPNTLLFLKNVDTVIIDVDNEPLHYRALRTVNKNVLNVTLKGKSASTSWSVIKSDQNSPEAIALPLNEQESLTPRSDDDDFLVYSFLPTNVKTGFKFLINGSFNTDPSRTQVILDEKTMLVIKNLVRLIKSHVMIAIEDPTKANKNLIDSISTLTVNPIAKFKSSLSFSDVFKAELINGLKAMKATFNGVSVSLASVYVKPEWINEEDYRLICNNLNLNAFDTAIFKTIPSLKDLFNTIDINRLNVDMLFLPQCNLEYVSNRGRIEIIKEYIKHNRFNFDAKKNDTFKSSTLFIDLYNEDFIQSLYNHVEGIDLSWFLSKLGLQKSTKSSIPSSISITPSNKKNIKSFSSKFSKWRAAEVNVKAYFESFEDVISVSDVSKSNLGYDIEVHRIDKVEYVEVKSVTNLGDSFSLTNNEYGVANEKKKDYILAIVKQSDNELELCLISNPIENLGLNRRVTRWEWVCDEYIGTVTSLKLS